MSKKISSTFVLQTEDNKEDALKKLENLIKQLNNEGGKASLTNKTEPLKQLPALVRPGGRQPIQYILPKDVDPKYNYFYFGLNTSVKDTDIEAFFAGLKVYPSENFRHKDEEACDVIKLKSMMIEMYYSHQMTIKEILESKARLKEDRTNSS